MAYSTIKKDYDVVVNDEDIMNLPDCKDELRVVLVGKTGNGKSATGNTIAGRNIFIEDISASSVTRRCDTKTTTRYGTKIRLIDTPGLFDTSIPLQTLQREICRCILMASPGPHVFLLVLRIGRFTKEERDAVRQLQEMFGEQARKHTIIVFTGKDTLDRSNKSIEEFISSGDSYLDALTKQCPYIAINNVNRDENQITELIQMIKNLVGSGYYSSNDFENAKKALTALKKRQKEEEDRKVQTHLRTIIEKNSYIEATIAKEKDQVNTLKSNFEGCQRKKQKLLEQNEAQSRRLKQEMTQKINQQEKDIKAFQSTKQAQLQGLQTKLDTQKRTTFRYQQSVEREMKDIKTQQAEGIRKITQNNERRLENFKESVKKTFPGEIVLGPCSLNGSPMFTVSYESSSRKFYITRDGTSQLDRIPGYNGLKVVQSTIGGRPQLSIQTLQGVDQLSLTM